MKKRFDSFIVHKLIFKYLYYERNKRKKGFDKSKERIRIEEKLLKKEDAIKFGHSDEMLLKIRRITIELNRKAREERIIEKRQLLYKVVNNKEAGYIQVVRNY